VIIINLCCNIIVVVTLLQMRRKRIIQNFTFSGSQHTVNTSVIAHKKMTRLLSISLLMDDFDLLNPCLLPKDGEFCMIRLRLICSNVTTTIILQHRFIIITKILNIAKDRCLSVLCRWNVYLHCDLHIFIQELLQRRKPPLLYVDCGFLCYFSVHCH
jgi:hypothetical protein